MDSLVGKLVLIRYTLQSFRQGESSIEKFARGQVLGDDEFFIEIQDIKTGVIRIGKKTVSELKFITEDELKV